MYKRQSLFKPRQNFFVNSNQTESKKRVPHKVDSPDNLIDQTTPELQTIFIFLPQKF
jgi:hypothetical protein